MGRLVAGQNCADDFADPDHVAIHAAGFARGVGDGNAERETRFRSAGHGVELFQSRLDHCRGGNRLLARSAFRCAFAGGPRDRDADRWRVAIDGTISVAVESRLQVSRRFSLARRRRAHGLELDGAGGHRGQRGAGECFNQQRICSRPWKWPGELAQHCVSPDAIAAGNFWCGHRDSYVAAGVEERRAREHG